MYDDAGTSNKFIKPERNCRMSRRGENIHKRKDGRWEARYKKGRDENGELIYGSVYGKTYGEAKERLNLIKPDEVFTGKIKKGEKTLGEVINMWLENSKLRLKGATVHKYQGVIDTHILPGLGNIRLSQLTAAAINSYLNEKLHHGRIDEKGGLSPSYVNIMGIIIKSAIHFAVDERLMQPLRTEIVKAVRKHKASDLSVLSVEEQRILEASLEDQTDQTDKTKLGVVITLNTGLRIGEICALSWDDIDLDKGVIHVRHTVARVRNDDLNSDARTVLIIDTPKTLSSARDIPISSHLSEIISDAKAFRASGYVVSDSDLFISPRTYEYRYHKLLKRCGIAPFNYHALRHTFATRCIEAGIDVKSLSEILGHANVGITLNTYVHSSFELKRRQMEKLNAFPASS